MDRTPSTWPLQKWRRSMAEMGQVQLITILG